MMDFRALFFVFVLVPYISSLPSPIVVAPVNHESTVPIPPPTQKTPGTEQAKTGTETGIVNRVSEVMKFLLLEIEDIKKEEMRLENERKDLDFFYNRFGQIVVSSRPRYG